MGRALAAGEPIRPAPFGHHLPDILRVEANLDAGPPPGGTHPL